MNAVWENPFTRSLEAMGRSVAQKPKAILVVSAHWLTCGTYVSATANPETIYDFSGFPAELYRLTYPAPGSPRFAKEVSLLADAKQDSVWGLDHGAWAVLKHMFPLADIPVFQLSIDYHKPMQHHYDLAKKLRTLRDEGVLIIGSGNIVHNLRYWFAKRDNEPYDWTLEFDGWVKDRIQQRDFQNLVNYEQQGSAAKLAVPTVDHYVPMLYALSLADTGDDITFTYEELFTAASMRCFRIG
jgi:4,5-DOPA dioxygenase extradiol